METGITWGDLKRAIEKAGVTNNDFVHYIDWSGPWKDSLVEVSRDGNEVTIT